MERNKELQKFIDKLSYDMFGYTEEDCCISCKKKITGFRNSISAKEYGISGFCQGCQDSVFGVD